MAAKDKNQDVLERLLERLETIEEGLDSVKKTLSDAGIASVSATPSARSNKSAQVVAGPVDGKIIEGVFNGQNMVGPEGKIYPVKANYASKSNLVEGDKLKLTITDDGSFIFKQIGPIERKKLIGTLKLEDDQYVVEAEGRNYNVLYASVTFFKAKPGDEITVVVPKDKEDAHWAAIEAVLS